MTKRLTGFGVLAVTLLVLASAPMFNQPTAVAQTEGGGACVIGPSFVCAFAASGDDCISIQGMWYGEGSFCQGGKLACDSVFLSCPPESVACCLGDGTCLVIVPNVCLESGGTPSNTFCFEVTCDQPCDADVDGDGNVGINDFLDLLAAWGPCP